MPTYTELPGLLGFLNKKLAMCHRFVSSLPQIPLSLNNLKLKIEDTLKNCFYHGSMGIQKFSAIVNTVQETQLNPKPAEFSYMSLSIVHFLELLMNIKMRIWK